MRRLDKRIHSLDIFRGLGIAIIIIIHRIHYHWTGMSNPQIMGQYMRSSLAPLIFITIAFFTMAGIFYVISGTANSFMFSKRLMARKNTSQQLFLGGILSGVWFFILNYFQRIFLMNGFLLGSFGEDPEYPIGLFIGYLQNPEQVTFRFNQITEPGTLAVIGLILISVSCVLYLLTRKNGFENPKKIYTTLAIFAATFLLASPFIKYLLLPVYDQTYASGNYAAAFFLGFFSHEFSLFPYLGYGFCGSIFGIAIARKESYHSLQQKIFTMTKLLFFFGLLALAVGNRATALGERLMGAGISYIELAIFLLLGLFGFKYWDLASKEKAIKRQKRTRSMQRFGKLALTIYLFEPLVAELLKMIIDRFFGSTWPNNLLLVIVFGFICLIFWAIIIRIWENIAYTGSIEWFSKKILYQVSKKDSSGLPTMKSVYIRISNASDKVRI